MFVDKVEVQIQAGNGGNGIVSFRHEKFVDKGGPDGGDGGRGGDVVFVGDSNVNTLVNFRYKQEITAADGKAGSKRNQRGRSAESLLVKVPVGTQIYREGVLDADITQPGQRVIIARGGDGGFGNAHFKSSVRQTPKVAELGEKGEAFTAILELKLLADIGLVGFPNAGKSTFLSVVTNAKPEIADYPFTTLKPNLGVADIDETSLLLADIPGLIEGASEGKGLGDEFLRHVERTAVLIHLIDIYEPDVARAYTTITQELVRYNAALAARPQLVALTKIEGLPEDSIAQQKAALQKVLPADTLLFAISSRAHMGLQPLLRAANQAVLQVRQDERTDEAEQTVDVPIISLSDAEARAAWRVVHDTNGQFIVTGHKIEKFAARTNFDTEPGIRRLWDIMRKMGITYELERKGIAQGSVVIIGRGGTPLVYGTDIRKKIF